MSVKRENLENLTSTQLKDILKKVSDKLNLKVQGKNKTELVDALYNLNHKNKFYGKKLLSLDNSGHIQLPARKQRINVKAIKEGRKKIREKKAEVAKFDVKMKKLDELSRALGYVHDPKGAEKIMDEFKKLQSS